MRETGKKAYKRRYKRRNKVIYKKRWFWDFVVLIILSLGISWLLFSNSYFQIKDVEIAGGEKFSKMIRDIIGQNLNFFLLDTSSISKKIQESFPEIGDVIIERQFPDKVVVTVAKRKPVAILCNYERVDNCFLLASDGVIFQDTKEKNNLPKFLVSNKDKIKIGDTVLNREILGNLIFLEEELQKFEIIIEEIYILPHELKVKTRNGFKIFFLKDDNLKIQIEALIQTLRESISKRERRKLDYIDLRGVKKGDKSEIYFK